MPSAANTNEVSGSQPTRHMLGTAITLFVLIALLGVVVSFSVVVFRSRAEEQRTFHLTHERALRGIETSRDQVLSELRRALASNDTDNRSLLQVITEARSGLGDLPVPVVDGSLGPRAERLQRAGQLGSEWLQSLRVLAASRAPDVDKDMVETANESWRLFEAALDSAYKDARRRSPAVGSEVTVVRAFGSRQLRLAEEQRQQADIAAKLESDHAGARAELQRYHDSVVEIFPRYEGLRQQLEARDAGKMLIRSSADANAFKAIFAEATAARYRLVEQLKLTSPPDVFTDLHQRLTVSLTHLADVVAATTAASEEAPCYDATLPCTPVGKTPTYLRFLAATALYDEYSSARDSWVRTYETELKRLYQA